MGKITKTMQPKHKENLSPWLTKFVDTAVSIPVPLLPRHLSTFPSRWPFPRGDLHHWIPLLNRFDSILETFGTNYRLNDGPQMRDFCCEILLSETSPASSSKDGPYNLTRLVQLGYKEDGDAQLIIAVLKFTRMLLEHCGNRSIYSSSSHLSDLLNSTSLSIVSAAMEVGLELAQRYHASVKRMPTSHSRHLSSALLASHYNIDLDRVQLLAQPFVKTPIVNSSDALSPGTPSPSTSRGKEKEKAPGVTPKPVASVYANDLVSLATPEEKNNGRGRWDGWGDVRVIYYPKVDSSDAATHNPAASERFIPSTAPATPTPLRRSTTVGSPQHSPRTGRHAGADDSPLQHRNGAADEAAPAAYKVFEVPQALVKGTSIYSLLGRCPPDMPPSTRYEVLNRLRAAKALMGSVQSRQQALAARLLSITNLAYIHQEAPFVEKVLKQDNDEPRRYQLVYQLAEMIQPSATGSPAVPLWLQAVALTLLEAVSSLQSKYPDVLSALNANVNHGVLLYVIRKAVAEMKNEDDEVDDGQVTESDEWRNSLFSLTLHLTIGNRLGNEMIQAGLMDILVEILNIRSEIAYRNHSMVLAFLDGLIYNFSTAFQPFVNAHGLDAISKLIVDSVSTAKVLNAQGQGTQVEFRSHLVDYEIPFYQQQTLKWLLKFVHHVMTNAFTTGGNTDRLLRNLVDNSHLLGALREIMESMKCFGSVVWTNSATLLSDFINNDPTSFGAILESGMIESFLQAITGHATTYIHPKAQERPDAEGNDSAEGGSPSRSEDSVPLDTDNRPHPPTQEMLEKGKDHPAAHGILPSSEAITVIPTVLNSISLNSTGMRMVAASRAFESFFEIFESPAHTRCMNLDMDLASNIGGAFDELARHHPPLQRPISNAVLDMIARFTHFAKEKASASGSGWGAKLLVTQGGMTVTADDHLLDPFATGILADASKEGATVEDGDDFEMPDPAGDPGSNGTIPGDSPELVAESSPSSLITPYILAVSTFLSSYISNHALKKALVKDGGIEYLLDLTELPSLPFDFCETAASRGLQHIVSQLVEYAPHLGLPSLLHRIMTVVDTLAPLLHSQNGSPFFAPFLLNESVESIQQNDEWGHATVSTLAKGTRVVKGLLNAQSLIKTLYQCFPYSSRHSGVVLHGVNVFDYYVRLIQSLGPLLRAVLQEEMGIVNKVPQHWVSQKRTASQARQLEPARNGIVLPDGPSDAGGDTDIADVLSGNAASREGNSTPARQLTVQEEASPRYRNFKLLHHLLHSLMPTTFPLFQTIGKTLLPKRERDLYSKQNHFAIADALSEIILEQLTPLAEEPTTKDFHYRIIMLHTVHEMLVDPSRQSDRSSGIQIILPVLLAFKERGGLQLLNDLLDGFGKEVCKTRAPGDDATWTRLASMGMKKVLDLYVLLANGKIITDSLGSVGLTSRPVDRRPESASNQLIVELRLAILPAIRLLWESDLVEKASTEIMNKVVDILSIITNAENESSAYKRDDKNLPVPLLRRESAPFNWSSFGNQISRLVRDGHDLELAREAIYRTFGSDEAASEYCQAHKSNRAGPRNPIPLDDAFKESGTSDSSTQTPNLADSNLIGPEAMVLDNNLELEGLLGEAVLGDVGDRSSQVSEDHEQDIPSQPSDSQEVNGSSAPSANNVISTPGAVDQDLYVNSRSLVSKEDLDEERDRISEGFIERCLDVIRAHPDSAHEISELIRSAIMRQESEDLRQEVGQTLAEALVSFAGLEAIDKSSGQSIAAYAHLLSLLLQEKAFFRSTADTLRSNVGEYLQFLQISSSQSSEDLPPWIPYILLIFEILLQDDEQLPEVRWSPPNSENDMVDAPVLHATDVSVTPGHRCILLESVLDILPRVGKQDTLAISVLRLLVILTRDRRAARLLGDKKNLQRLFVMAKQLSGHGAPRLKESRIAGGILTILRHVVEDADIVKQTMRSEIRAYFENPSRRPNDIYAYLRHLSPVALRSPELFVEVTNDMVKLARWSPTSDSSNRHSPVLMLKEPPNPSKDDTVEPAVQATEGLSINDVKPSTESGDKEMHDVSKLPSHDVKRPIVENPDGVIHFLLCELLIYREVDDRDTSQPNKDSKHVADSLSFNDQPHSLASEKSTALSTAEHKDKKSKPTFKTEDHPIFVYRCFLLHCLSELLQSYTRSKVEFINFKRSQPTQNNTPVKPRSSVMNYIINDLLCTGTLNGTPDSIATKKKVATSSQAQLVLAALVAKTAERPTERTRDRFEYDDEPGLLFVRRFVLDTILKAYKDASASAESFEVRYARMLDLAVLMNMMIGDKDKEASPRQLPDSSARSHMQLKRLMYEKGYLAVLTSSIADIELNFPGVKRTIKYILRVLRLLTNTAIQLSHSNVIPSTTASDEHADEEIASASSLSDLDDDREETPDLYRNSALGMLEPGREDDFSDDSGDDDEEMYDDEFGDDMGYAEDMSEDEEENISDEDEELDEMGDMEGLSGDPSGVVEVIMGDDDDDEEDEMDEDDDDEDPSDDEDEDEMGSDEMEEVEDRIEIIDEHEDALGDDGASGWESETDEEDEEDIDFEAAAQEFDEVGVRLLEANNLRRLRAARAAMDPNVFDEDDVQDLDRFPEDAEDDDEEDDDEMEEDEFIIEHDHHRDDHPASTMPSNLGWDTLIVEQPGFGHRHRHGGMRSPFPVEPFMIGGPRDLGGDFRSYLRGGRSSQPLNNSDDGLNPLLRRSDVTGREASSRPNANSNVLRMGFPGGLLASGIIDSPMVLLNDLMATLPGRVSRGPAALHFQITQQGPGGEIRELNIPVGGQHASRDPRPETRRDTYQEPQTAVSFSSESTAERWTEEARMVFGLNHTDKSSRLTLRILAELTSPAMQEYKETKAREAEEKRKADEERREQERNAREAKEAEEKASREKKEAEEQERAAQEAVEAAQRAQAADNSQPVGVSEETATTEPDAMEGVETSANSPTVEQAERVAAVPRMMTTIRGEEFDVTDLGIDPEYLAALPEEFREEVIAQTVSTRRSEAREAGDTGGAGEQTEVFQEFLDALPEELRHEIVQQERQERRRREQDERRRQAAAAGGQDVGPQDMDPASILLTLPEELRQEALMSQGEEILDQLPPDLAAQARALAQRHSIPHRNPPSMARARQAIHNVESGDDGSKIQRRAVVQMLDKAGVATLLRLMFITQQGSIRNHLFGVLSDVCENRQNRLEVVSTLLQVLQDGSTDMGAVERSFGQLSLKAKLPKDKDPKTPTSLKRTFTNMSASTHIQSNSDVSPLLVVQQCLDLFIDLSKNPHIPWLFLTEHESVGTSLKRTLSRKGKGKDKDIKAHKFAVNSLLSLLDRDLIMESSNVMQLLADLLNRVTVPLQALDRRKKEAEEEARKGTKKEPTTAPAGGEALAESAETERPASTQIAEDATTESDETQQNTTAAQDGGGGSTDPGSAVIDQKGRPLLPDPIIPVENLRLVIKIFVARECSSKTFQNTIATIKNLCTLDTSKQVFGSELVAQAKNLSKNIVSDLDELLPHILKAQSGTEIQGVALAKFSPGASEQNKLLRVLTALDHLFDNKAKKSSEAAASAAVVDDDQKNSLLGSLYYNVTFAMMWDKLGACLRAIRQRENMINVATILLPLIESLMVVCKNNALTDGLQPHSQVGKELLLSSPPPENRMAGLFFSFTEEHRRILNELVRGNPKLMSGTFALLVKNPKVLEFDNKRNYFYRSVKAGHQGRQAHTTLQLSVRRDLVFHDSFRALFYKSPEEMKFGKLHIRFHGEEGVDAGGVTREWFQVLARQMFNPNYALFIPVSSDRTTFHPNKLSSVNDEHLSFFKFIGRIIGKALFESRVLECYFSRAVYKRILGKQVSVKDMESFDPDYYKSLSWMLENDITDIITETFSVEDDEFGMSTVVDLCENGRQIPVTEENKAEYVRLVVEHKLLSSVKPQMEHFLKGFHEIIPAELVAIFNEQELELLISGLPDIDIDDWKGNTEYQNYTAASQQIQWFWRAVRSFDKEELAKLLQFVTGTSKVPLNGFKELEGMNGISRFNIHRDYGSKDRLPSSHTCFNQLDLPEYESYDVLRGRLLKAITTGSDYFGFA